MIEIEMMAVPVLLAQRFWQQLAVSGSVDSDFRAIAQQMAQQLAGLQPLIERMA